LLLSGKTSVQGAFSFLATEIGCVRGLLIPGRSTRRDFKAFLLARNGWQYVKERCPFDCVVVVVLVVKQEYFNNALRERKKSFIMRTLDNALVGTKDHSLVKVKN
jgi:hypothetical protein